MNGEIPLSAYAHAILRGGDLEPPRPLPLSPFFEAVESSCATQVVYDVLSRSDRRRHGIFFSGAEWARTLVSELRLEEWRRFVDPSVGSGDLLVEICRRLPIGADVHETIEEWSNRLVAIDLRESFLKIAWARIQGVALLRHQQAGGATKQFTPRPLPENFRVGDALEMSLALKQNDCVIMNPPYQRMCASITSFVGSGMRSAAALHLEHVLKEGPESVGIIALIPEVLRSGTSYRRFREEVQRRMVVKSFDSSGRFGAGADIDVAVLVGRTAAGNNDSMPIVETQDHITLGDYFSVRVGPVVPHRSAMDGPECGYLTAKNSRVGLEITVPPELATFRTRVECGPFIIVRRTSSPSDKKRARATLISSTTSFLVENHLLIIKAHSGNIAELLTLMSILDDPRTDTWLNSHIRCRHLTVSAVKKIPLWDHA
jgi:hypothetical protein